MKCYFCQYELGEPFYHGVPAPVMLTCDNCPLPVEYYFEGGNVVYEYRFSTLLNSRLYELSFRPKEEVFFVYEADGNLRYPVLKMNQIPNITPTNVAIKLITILVFL